ncbi:MAG: NrfD/PsrC family molybdoenzyme membrane anchor subunit [bacterium]
MTSYDVFHQVAFNWIIPAYFFLGGLSAGLFLIAVIFRYWRKDYEVLSTPAAVLSPLFLALGMGLLNLDLSQPFRFWRLMVTFQPSSIVSWGVWGLSIFFVLNLFYAYFSVKGEKEKAKKFGYLGIPFAVFAAAYSGLLLAQMQGRALWHTALLPWLFLLGAVISGLALVILVGIGTGKAAELGDKFFSLGKFLAWLVMLELGMIFTEILVLLNGGSDALVSVSALLSGPYSFEFWVLEILLGAIIPLLILFNPNKAKKLSLQSIAAVLVLVGIYTMRFVVVMAGQV